MLRHFQKLLQPGTVGFYRSACITTISLRERTDGKPVFRNIYTLATLQESEAKSNLIRKGISAPLQIDRFRSVMITYQEVDLGTIQQLHQSAIERGEWHQPHSSFPLVLEELRTLPPLLVPLHPEPPVCYGIKNSFRSCHYLLELFAEKKSLTASLTESQRRRIPSG